MTVRGCGGTLGSRRTGFELTRIARARIEMGAGVATGPHCPASDCHPEGFGALSRAIGRHRSAFPIPVPAEASLPRSVPVRVPVEANFAGFPAGSCPGLATRPGSRSNDRRSELRQPSFRGPLPKGSGSAGRLRKVGSAFASRFFLGSPCHHFAGFHSCECCRFRESNGLKLSSVRTCAIPVGHSRPHKQAVTDSESRQAQSTCG